MGALRISIGAAVDPSVARSFQQAEQAALRSFGRIRDARSKYAADAAAQEARALSKTQVSTERMAAARIRSAERLNAQIAAMDARAATSAERSAKRARDAEIRSFDERLRASKKARDAEERDIMRVAAAAERADQRKARAAQQEAQRGRSAFARELGSRSVSNMGQAARFGMGVAGQFARGAGITTDINSSVQRNVELERQAIDLSNSGYNPNAPEGSAARKRVDAADIQRDVKAAADANAFSRTEAMGGLQAFVAKTGDLEAGRKVIKDLGALSRATGTDLGDMVDAAGDVANALGEMGKGEAGAKRIGAVMKSIAGQGKMGAVEIKDLATQMAKLGAGSTAFEGDASENIALMGAFAQLARSKGGATSANIAAGSVSSMVNTLKTPARMKAFKEEGIDVVNKETGMLRNPQQILMAALAKTGGDPERLKKMYANVQGARAIEGSAQTFRAARADVLAKGGTQEDATAAGLKAVAAEFDELKKVAMGEGEIRESLNRALQSQSAKAQQFNNRMDDVVGNLQAKMAPALERAAPALIKLADIASSWVAKAVDNPGKAIVAVIVASIAKAGIETAISSGIASMFKRAAASAAIPVPGTGAGAGAAVPGGRALPVAAAALVGFGIGSAIGEAEDDAATKGDIKARSAATRIGNARHKLVMGGDLGEARRTLAAEEAAAAQADPRGWAEKNSPTGKYEAAALDAIGGAMRWATAGEVGQGWGRSLEETAALDAKAAQADATAKEIASLKAAVDAMSAKLSGNLNVTVTNQPAPGVDPGGRQPAPVP
jgi:hypothetical protein